MPAETYEREHYDEPFHEYKALQDAFRRVLHSPHREPA